MIISWANFLGAEFGVEGVAEAVVCHGTPAGDGGLDAEAEEDQEGLREKPILQVVCV